jgi:hypothetical protein
MKKAILGVLALATVGLGGCVSGDDEGSILVSWSITVNGRAGTCAEVGAANVRVIVREGGTTLDQPTFACALGGAELVIEPGTYQVQVDLFDAGNNQLNSVPFLMNATVRADRTANLGNVEFTFQLSFSPTFTVRWGSTNETCSSGGIVHEEIRISTGGACLDADVLVGGTPELTCERYVCAEGNVQRTLQDLPPGNYLVQVIGYKGATSATPRPCYYSDAVSCTSTACPATITALFDPLPEDEQFCNATKPMESHGP